jgi:hypothetical protein
MKNKCEKRADSRTKITASHHRGENMGVHCQLLSPGRGTLPLSPRLEGAVPAGEQQPDDIKHPDEGMPNRPSIFVYLVFGPGGIPSKEL